MVALTPSSGHSLRTTAVERGGGGHRVTEKKRERKKERKEPVRVFAGGVSFLCTVGIHCICISFLGIAGGDRRSEKAPPASRCYSWTIRVSSLTIERIIYENVAARVGTTAGKTGRIITVRNAFDIGRSFWSHGVQANQWAHELLIRANLIQPPFIR